MESAAAEKGPGLHPIAGASPGVYARHALCTPGLDGRSSYQRFIASVAQCVRLPHSCYERVRYGRAIARNRLEKPPVFLVGHWRSGTTHLHNLMSRDPQFGYLRFSETAMPCDMLGPMMKIGRRVIDRALPETRGFDNVRVTLDEPQEEEMALGNLNPIGYYSIYYFPRRMHWHRDRALFFEETTAAERERFKRCYRDLVHKTSLAKAGRQLLFKNPPSTTRMPLLKELFPGAKFVHIVRNPWPVFRSSVSKFPRLYSFFSWQEFRDLGEATVDYTLDTYEKVMRRYLRDREALALPPEDLAETTYEKITEDPVGEIGRIYDQLGLEGKEEGLREIARYAESIREYRPNVHRISARQAEEVRERWRFSFEEWGYPLEPPPEIEIV